VTTQFDIMQVIFLLAIDVIYSGRIEYFNVRNNGVSKEGESFRISKMEGIKSNFARVV